MMKMKTMHFLLSTNENSLETDNCRQTYRNCQKENCHVPRIQRELTDENRNGYLTFFISFERLGRDAETLVQINTAEGGGVGSVWEGFLQSMSSISTARIFIDYDKVWLEFCFS